MILIDTHSHIHEADFPAEKLGGMREILRSAAANDVRKIILIGTSMKSSRDAVNFAKKWDGFAGLKLRVAVGIHPHEADPKLARNFENDVENLAKLLADDDAHFIVAVGEIGLDYFYDFDFRARQIELLKLQFQLAKTFAKPVNFHIRDPKNPAEIRENNSDFNSVWDDFWPLYDEFFDKDFSRNILHSYTEQSRENLQKAVSRNLNFGVNGISTFAKKSEQNLWKNDLPLAKIVLETDAPFLAPNGFRGQINQPARIRDIAQNLANFREKTLDEIAKITSENAEKILGI